MTPAQLREHIAPDDVPTRECPRCGDSQRDLDGFGALYCQKCGFCTHASITAGVCDFCEKEFS